MLKAGRPRNKFEQKLWDQLKKAKVKFKYESEKIPYILTCRYLPDFILTVRGRKIYIEAKGKFDSVGRRKMANVVEQHPELDIRLVFYNAQSRISKQSKTTYGQWAAQHNIKWADKVIPESWYK